VLSCVFVRFLEDNALIDPPKIAGPGKRLQQAGGLELFRTPHAAATPYLLFLSQVRQRLFNRGQAGACPTGLEPISQPSSPVKSAGVQLFADVYVRQPSHVNK
jgi:hypothetical protein